MKTGPESPGWQLGEALIQVGWLEWSQLHQANAVYQKSGLFLGEPAIPTKLNHERAYRALASHYQLPFVDLNHFTIRAEAIQMIPSRFVFQYKIIPIVIKSKRLVVAITHPRDRLLRSLIQSMTKVDDVRMVIACPDVMEKAIEGYYGVYQKAA